GEHLLVYINPCDPIRHGPLLTGAESVPLIALVRVAGYSRSLEWDQRTPNYSLNYARSGSSTMTASVPTLTKRSRRSRRHHSRHNAHDFHPFSRVEAARYNARLQLILPRWSVGLPVTQSDPLYFGLGRAESVAEIVVE